MLDLWLLVFAWFYVLCAVTHTTMFSILREFHILDTPRNSVKTGFQSQCMRSEVFLQNLKLFFGILLIRFFFFLIKNINSFRGDLSGISAKKLHCVGVGNITGRIVHPLCDARHQWFF